MFAVHGGQVVGFVAKFGSGLKQYVPGIYEVTLGGLVHRQADPKKEENLSVDDARCACCKDEQSDVDCHRLHLPFPLLLFRLLWTTSSHGERL